MIRFLAMVHTNLSHESLLSFVWMKLLRFRETVIWEELRRHKSSSLGMSKASQDNISKKSQASKLGDAPVGIPPFFFNNYRLVSVDPKFLLLHMMFAILRMSFYFALLAVWIKYQDLKFLNVRESSHSCIIIRLLIDLHLYLSE